MAQPLEIDFAPWAAGTNANVEDQASYLNDATRLNGNSAGTASSAKNNKALRQGTMMASAIALFIANTLSTNVIDDGNVAALTNLFQEALTAYFSAPSAAALVHGGPDNGTANALSVTCTPQIQVLQPEMLLITIANASSVTSATPAQLTTVGSTNITAPLKRADGTDIRAGDIKTGRLVVAVTDANLTWRLVNTTLAVNGGLAGDGGGNLLLGFDNLPVGGTVNGADKLALCAEEGEDGVSPGQPFSATVSTVGAYIASLFEQAGTFAQISSTNLVGLSLAQAGDYAIPQNAATTIPFYNISVNAAFGSVTPQGILQVFKTGYYVITLSGAMFLQSSNHAVDEGKFILTFILGSGAGTGGAVLSGSDSIASGGGQAAVNFLTSIICHLNANDIVYVQALGKNQYGDAANVGVSGYTNMLVALLNAGT